MTLKFAEKSHRYWLDGKPIPGLHAAGELGQRDLWPLMARPAARQPHQLRAADGGVGLSRGAALAQAAAFTLLNPHVYLDTVLLVGSIGAQQPAALTMAAVHLHLCRPRHRLPCRHLYSRSSPARRHQ